MNRSGSVTDGACGLNPARLGALWCGAVVLAAADMGNKASIRLFFALAQEAALFQLGMQVHGAPISAGTQPGAFRQGGQRLQDLH